MVDAAGWMVTGAVTLAAFIFTVFFYAVNSTMAEYTALGLCVLFGVATIALFIYEENQGTGKGGA